MIIEVKVPQLSESVSEATLLEWHKKEGEAVSRDENLIDIETDKVVMELPAPADGVLTKILKTDRVAVVAGEVIATIDTDAKPAAGAAAKPAAPATTPSAPPREAPPVMPAAEKLAAEQGIDTSKIQGSGLGGRVTKGDVLEHVGKPASYAGATPARRPRRLRRPGARCRSRRRR